MRLTLALIVWLGVTAVEAGPVAVRMPEGNTRGFLVLRSLAGENLARGELRQKPAGVTIESTLVLDFRDGSHREEVTTFTQSGVFRLEAYRLVQRGPAFPRTEVAFDRKSGRYTALVQEKPDGAPETASEPLDMPADLYNGIRGRDVPERPGPAARADDHRLAEMTAAGQVFVLSRSAFSRMKTRISSVMSSSLSHCSW